MTAKELIASVKRAAKLQREKLHRLRPHGVHLSYLTTNDDTSELLLNTISEDPYAQPRVSSKVVTLDNLYVPSEDGKLDMSVLTAEPATTSSSNTSDVKPENDSTKDDSTVKPSLSGEEQERLALIEELTKQLQPLYGEDPVGLEYSLSISNFARSNEYTVNLVSSLLTVLTAGQHRSVASKFSQLLNESSSSWPYCSCK